MTVMFLLNLLLAVILASSRGELSGGSLLVGVVVGYVILYIGKPIFRNDQYFPRIRALVAFLGSFFMELVKSTHAIALAVLLRRRRDMHPNLITYSVEGMARWEILILSQCITLTPGTTTVDISPDLKVLVVHAFDAQDPEAVRRTIDRGLKEPLLAWSRPC